MNFCEYVKTSLVKMRKDNIAEVRNNISADWVVDKITNYCNRFEGLFTFQQIKNEILFNDVVASFFAKDPLKQNIAEKLCGNWIGCKNYQLLA